jgi:hypothetical protein
VSHPVEPFIVSDVISYEIECPLHE